MTSVKIAVSIPQELFDRAETEAGTLQVSRSKLFANAMEEYLYQQENRRICEEIDAAYGEPDPEEKAFLETSRRAYARVLEREAQEEGAWVEDWGTKST